jgi:hypothetical protein
MMSREIKDMSISSQPISQHTTKCSEYVPPMVYILIDSEPESGNSNVPEGSNGLLES